MIEQQIDTMEDIFYLHLKIKIVNVNDKFSTRQMCSVFL